MDTVETNLNPHPHLLVFSDDWGRHPSSCQHLIGQLLGEHSVTWVNTIGMRPPRLDLLTVRRGFEKIHSWLKPNGKAENTEMKQPEGLSVVDAKMWPWMKHSWDRQLNRYLLSRQLDKVSEESIAITTIPIVSDLIGKLPVTRWIYYCVDDFSVWPGLDGRSLLRQENELLEKVDRVICVSKTLQDSVGARGRESELLTHGVDLDFWRYPERELEAHDFGLLPNKPIALFWGVIDRRMNADWLLALADQLSSESIVLAGPVQDPDPRILTHNRVELIGPIEFNRLPSLAKLAKVLIMPYDDLPVTRAMQPLKLKEYLATSRPVVASPLPAVKPLAHCLEMTETKESFIEVTLSWLRSETQASPNESMVQKQLASETWKAKANQLAKLISK